MDVTVIDERDVRWEKEDAVFLVYLFTGGGGASSWAVKVYRIADADLKEVIDWAEDLAGAESLYAVAIALGDGVEMGNVWLLGMDANKPIESRLDRVRYDFMLDRRDRRLREKGLGSSI